MECLVPVVTDFVSNIVYPHLCEKWDEVTSKKCFKYQKNKA
ncbi:hypothetical protein SAMN04487770_12844 [Butyrivibrio sp. ob235]|nr:hypothetical protein SAMN04487770_12844 [Butyrivibrio sp. ob235]